MAFSTVKPSQSSVPVKHSAVLRGTPRIYVIDRYQQSLDLAASIGAIPINYNVSDLVQQIMALEPKSVNRAVDAVGMEQQHMNCTLSGTIVLQQAM